MNSINSMKMFLVNNQQIAYTSGSVTKGLTGFKYTSPIKIRNIIPAINIDGIITELEEKAKGEKEESKEGNILIITTMKINIAIVIISSKNAFRLDSFVDFKYLNHVKIGVIIIAAQKNS